MLKMGHPDIIKVKWVLLGATHVPCLWCIPGMHPACAMSQKVLNRS